MLEGPATYPPDLIPGLRYRDARAAIAWLERTLGFAQHLVVDGEGDAVAHAEMRLGRGYVMLGSAHRAPDAYGLRTPGELGGRNTQGVYVGVADAAAAYARATAAGATIVSSLAQTYYGSLDFSLRDPEGYLWYVGTYRPAVPALRGETASQPEIYATARYADARAAMTFLSRAFGAAEHFVVPGDRDVVAHAELAFGSSLFMLGSTRDDDIDMVPPAAVHGAGTHSVFGHVVDVDAHCKRAAAGGAEIVTPPHDTPYGSRAYVARDCEAHVWTFGTYRPESVSVPIKNASE